MNLSEFYSNNSDMPITEFETLDFIDVLNNYCKTLDNNIIVTFLLIILYNAVLLLYYYNAESDDMEAFLFIGIVANLMIAILFVCMKIIGVL